MRKMACYVVVPAEALRGKRWDPAFWRPDRAEPATAWPFPHAPLGDFIQKITYGPILTGQRPQPVANGVAIIDQKVIRASGVLLGQAIVVAEGCAYDPPRCRLEPGDIVFARSGAGTLAKRRFTVFGHPVKATVSCFVDLIRLAGISPHYVVTFLRSRPGWSRIERLINGVGTPNLSFAEIRSLEIPLLPRADQEAIERAWVQIGRLHDAGRLVEAEAALDEAVLGLERQLEAAGGQGR